MLKEVQQKFGDVYRNYLAGMLEFDPAKRVKIHELSYNIEHSEYFVVSTYHGGPKVSFSEHFEFYKKTFQLEAGLKHFTRTIAIAIPLTRSLLMANLFDKKKMFLEILDLKIHSLIPEGSVTLVTDDVRILVLGGAASRNVLELDESASTLI